jgi:hypothetical protein
MSSIAARHMNSWYKKTRLVVNVLAAIKTDVFKINVPTYGENDGLEIQILVKDKQETVI